MTHWFNYPILILIAIFLFIIVISEKRKWITASFAVVVFLFFTLNIQQWTLTFTLSKTLTALTTIVILNISPIEEETQVFGRGRTGIIFRASSFFFGLILILFTSTGLSSFLGVNYEQTLAAFFLIVCGIVQVGISGSIHRTILGLLLFFQGFEIIFGSVEQSILINGMIDGVDLLIAIVGSYILNQSSETVEL